MMTCVATSDDPSGGKILRYVTGLRVTFITMSCMSIISLHDEDLQHHSHFLLSWIPCPATNPSRNALSRLTGNSFTLLSMNLFSAPSPNISAQNSANPSSHILTRNAGSILHVSILYTLLSSTDTTRNSALNLSMSSALSFSMTAITPVLLVRGLPLEMYLPHCHQKSSLPKRSSSACHSNILSSVMMG